MEKILELLSLLEEKKIDFHLSRNRIDALTVNFATIGNRYELDFLSDNEVEYSVFKGDESVDGGWPEIIELVNAE